MKIKINKFIFTNILFTLFFSGISFAESITYSTTLEQSLCPVDPGGSRCTAPGIVNPHIDVQYNYRVTDANTGAIIPCGGTVPPNSKLKFEILTPDEDDIYWFATGGSWDSPYGEFRPNASAPAANTVCKEKNFYATLEADLFAVLSVNPPTLSINTNNNLSCTGEQNYKTCTMPNSGSVDTSLIFSETYGYFYSGENHPGSPRNGQCDWETFPDPMIGVISFGNYTGTYKFVVPQQSKTCSINIGTSNGPSVPNITLGGSCGINTNYTISVVSTDSANLPITYQVDWDNDGLVDQTTNQFPSGTATNISRSFSTPGNKTISVYAVNSSGARSNPATVNFTCGTNSCVQCSKTNICGQNFNGTDCGNGCNVGFADINSTCIENFSCGSGNVAPNGTIECSWQVSGNVGSRCGFVDLTTPIPRPIPGLQNLDPSVDRIRISNIQTTTRFCLVCQFYSLLDQSPLGDVAAHQWIRVLRIGEN